MRYLDPKNDLTFKKVFGEHPHLLLSFLNALLPLEEDQRIESLEYIPAELVPQLPVLKQSIVDVRCTDNRGRQFIVEMQMLWTDSFKNRVLFNASKAYVKQLDRGHKYKGLKPVYALSLVNENFETGTDTYYHHYSIVHTQFPERQIEGLQFVFIELPKFRAQNITEKRLQVLWLRFLTEIEDGTEQLPGDLLDVPEVREAIEYLQESAFTKEELETYDKYWDSVSRERTLIEDAYEKGEQQGEQRGEERGEQKKAVAIARSMKAKGFEIATIAELTGLNSAYIEQL
ncbi:Rpn family recombination-promoting nuclease/putative transposase [Phaeodactylibacter sp.]|uniref:Rpn family recombination-promoting nuclease/putative transposase n=1 Tax=Phaeodactylibacter sp. TaxID=1940289 RepID=UPI0032EB6386